MADTPTVLDHTIIAVRYFYPRPARFPEPYWVEAADGSRLACYYRSSVPEAKTVIYFHGNGEVVSDYLPDFPEWFVNAGYNCLMAEYRGYGMSTGRPALAGMLDDVERIIDSLGVPDRQVVLFGRSIGSLYAVHGVSRRPQLAGLILESGISDISERFFMRVQPEELGMSREDVIRELNMHFDYAHKLRAFQGKTLILHTRHDELVPVHHAERLHAAAPEPKQLEIFERGGHNDIFVWNREAYMALVEAFVANA
ncbi:alpha/beta hydrolase [Candidatus Entotheonella serta]|nr:alpha/beta hydrolase [Candidatus Entotheonella serta]